MNKTKSMKILNFTLFLGLILLVNITVTQFTAASTNFHFSTYFGGSQNESQDDTNDLGKMSIEVDNDDNIIVVGRTFSSNYPVTYAIPGFSGGNSDIFVSKFSSDGSTLLFSTLLGGGGKDWATDVVCDSAGNIYIVGTTASSNFYLNNSEQLVNNGGSRNDDAWIAKITPFGVIEWCRYFGGSEDDWGYSIGVDSEGNVYITGSTYSNDMASKLPGVSQQGAVDFYLAKFNSSGHVQFSTLLGSTGNDWGQDIEIDSNDDIVIAGGTMSSDFPTLNAHYSTVEQMDGAIMKYNSDGELLFATIIGGPGQDRLMGMALDDSDDIYFTGRGSESSLSSASLITNDYSSHDSSFSDDAFAGKLTNNGQKLKYLTVFGGDDNDYGLGIDVDSNGNAYIVGETISSDFLVREEFDEISSGRQGFQTVLNSKGRILTSSTFGGSQNEICSDVKMDSTNNAVMLGFTDSVDFPIVNAHPGNDTLNGGSDLYIMSLSLTLPAIPKFPTSLILWTSISGSVGFLAIVGLVIFLIIKKKRVKPT